MTKKSAEGVVFLWHACYTDDTFWKSGYAIKGWNAQQKTQLCSANRIIR